MTTGHENEEYQVHLDEDLVEYLADSGEADYQPTTAELAEQTVNRDVQDELRSFFDEHRFGVPEDDLDEEPSYSRPQLMTKQEAQQVETQFLALQESILRRTPENKFDPTLERVKMAFNLLGDPQLSYRSVHVSGTNGKTSTSRMLSALLQASGRKVGRYTSPHLNTMCERICVNEEPISQAQFLAAYADVAPYISIVDDYSKRQDGPQLSFFEVLTVVGLAAFADIPVDAAVVEVGIGGLWDATNVLDAEVSVITPIGIDHQAYLGDTAVEAAQIKADIIKPGAIAVSALQEPEVEEVLRRHAQKVGAQIRFVGDDIMIVDRRVAVGGQVISVQTPAALYQDIFVPLHGIHQAQNAALALAAMEAFNGGRAVEASIVEEGFAMATSPGRMEIVRTSPSILVDAAHNPHGAHALAEALGESFDYSFITGVYAAMADKDVESVLAELEPVLDEIVVTTMNSPRAMDVEELAEIASDVFGPDRVHLQRKLIDAVDKAVELCDSTLDPATSTGVVVFGSVVLAGEARELLMR
ncbi:bifunctional folylpolyglutamate synthase/dihydrofolate synthase [Gleimia sp. 6138-11-ORH1]|uniref:bifunctional folylpolyglutamate synthase/dihydrofolate synthase n=1 Tax=Gleimia sp. 6138-11-ORH1 TaxID=2973937 RepID=UPI002169BA31|nr:folylpolyglutamate synthase/dihydrofolate synthase family protein [Gleimia sp. 6138-11-ORH1]MCS4484874.1 bifunctional folylpolyglutamate synthase/dihydrofolate synthase [Gleimia sp. 6138-11-ORH1]